ncbi:MULTISPECIES: hypothetical protein [Candidatus Nitrosocaldus]|jgi:hypothetical protein|uniref:hypothetical protein n=1 Tax=Candidatus Nitrosocaldus TaxID=498374 RepID=UPI0013151707|nr:MULTISPECIES: hypothetical protein [Candidatus Nitrosocaldus]
MRSRRKDYYPIRCRECGEWAECCISGDYYCLNCAVQALAERIESLSARLEEQIYV